MKIIKVTIIASIMILATTSSVFASWWNPMSWFRKPKTEKVVIQQTNTLVASTTSNQNKESIISNEVVKAYENISQKSESEGQGTTTATAYIVSISDNKIVLDYVDVFSGKEAAQKKMLDGLCEKEDNCFQGIPIYNRNSSTKLRTFLLSKNVTILDGRGREVKLEILASSSMHFISHMYKEDPDASSGRNKNLEYRYGSIFTFTFNSKNEIIKITEHFSP